MKIGVYSTKGGVGKSSIAFSIATDLGYNLYTNDMVDYLRKYKKAKFYTILRDNDNTVYDFGGFRDKKADNFVEENLETIIVPILNDVNSVTRALEAGRKFKHKKVIFVINAVETKKDIEQVKMVLNHYFENPEILHLRKTNLFKSAMEKGISPKEFAEKSFHKHVYKNILTEYDKLLKRIKED